MRISDWSSDVCSSDLISKTKDESDVTVETRVLATIAELQKDYPDVRFTKVISTVDTTRRSFTSTQHVLIEGIFLAIRSEEHTSELQSLMRISYAVFCLKKNKSHH